MMATNKWFTVSRNPIGWKGSSEESFHVEPGRVRGQHHVQARTMQEAISKVYGKGGRGIAGGGTSGFLKQR